MKRPVTLRVGKQGRLVLPATIRAELGINDGDTLYVQVEGGTVVIDTSASIEARVWAASPTNKRNSQEDIRAVRAQDTLIADEASARRSAVAADPAVGAGLLKSLGL